MHGLSMDLNAVLRRAVESGASDIHLKVGQPPFLRCDGRFDDLWISEPGLLREQPLGAARAEPFDQPKNRQGRVNTSARPLGGDHAR